MLVLLASFHLFPQTWIPAGPRPLVCCVILHVQWLFFQSPELQRCTCTCIHIQKKTAIKKNLQSNGIRTIFNWMSKVIRNPLGFTYFCSVTSKKTRAILQPIRCKTKDNRDFVTRVFPRFRPAARFHLEFSSANDYVIPCSDWSLGLLWFGFSTINWKLLWDLISWGVDQLLCPYNNCDKLFLSWQNLYAICCNPISFAHPNSFRHLWVLLHFVIVN